jgi:ubiquinone/menaquinone biosynthesis C-methylase UbiE
MPQITKKGNQYYYKDIEDYDWVKAVESWVGIETWFHRMRQRAQLKAVKKFAKGKILDAGCGTGMILRHLPKGAVGLDLNIRHLDKAAKYAPEAKLILGEVENLPFTNSIFGTVINGDMLGCVLEPEGVLKEFHRVLRKRGKLILSISKKSLGWRLRFLSKGPREPVYRLFDREELAVMLNQVGFKIIEVFEYALGMELLVVAEKRS